MNRAAITLAAAAATLSLATFSTAAEAPTLSPAAAAGTGLPKGECILRRDIQNHTLIDRNTILLSANGDTYRVMVDGCLTTAVQSDPITVRTPQGRTTVCQPADLEIGIFKGGYRRCIVQSIVRMPPAEVAALPRKLQP